MNLAAISRKQDENTMKETGWATSEAINRLSSACKSKAEQLWREVELSKTVHLLYLSANRQPDLGPSQVALVLKKPPANVGDVREMCLIPVLGRSPAVGHGNPLQYSCLENPMDRRAWWATVHSIA